MVFVQGCAKALARAGCEIHLVSNNGDTGRSLAVKRKHAAVLDQLDKLEEADSVGSSDETLDDKILNDLRADFASARASGIKLSEKSIEKSVVKIMKRMTKLKLGQPRPHYTRKQQNAFNEELMLKQYSPMLHRCCVCQAPPSEKVKLKICANCTCVWYCSKQ